MEKEKILLSVVVPIYKVEKYLCQCIDSLISQPLENIEIILVDDGSPDRAPQICDDYAERYENITVVHKINGGVVSARKEGTKCSRGEYITFIDGDDWVATDYLGKICSLASKYNPDIIALTKHFRKSENKDVIIYNESNRKGLFERNKLESEVFENMLYMPPYFNFGILPTLWSKVIRRSLLEEIMMEVPEDIRMGEDLAVTLPCMLKANTVYYSDVCGYYYRLNPSSMTRTFDPTAPMRINSLLNYLGENLANATIFNMQNQIAMYAIFILNFTLISLTINSKDIHKDLEKTEILWKNVYVKKGLNSRIPFKEKLLLFAAKYKQVLFLKILQKHWKKMWRSK